MRLLRLLSTIVVILVVTAQPVSGVTVEQPSALLPQSPLIVTAYSVTQVGAPRYVEIYNNGDTPLRVNEWSLVFEWAGKTAAATPTPLTRVVLGDMSITQYIAPGGYILAGFGGAVPDALVLHDAILPNSDNYMTKLSVQHTSYRPYERSFAASVTQSPMRLNRGASGYTTTYAAEDRSTLWQSGFYELPAEPALRIVEILPNPVSCSPFEQSERCIEYVKLVNPTDHDIDLSGFRLRTGSYGQGASTSTAIGLSGTLVAGAYGVFPLALTNSGSWVWLEDTYGIVQYTATVVAYPDSSSKKAQAWSQDNTGVWRWTQHPTPYNTPNQFTDGHPVNGCAGLRLSEIGANISPQFIELYNASQEPLNLRGCQVQTNRSSEISYVFGDVTLGPGDYTVVNLADTKLTLTKTTTGTVYILSSDGQSEVDARSYENLSENTTYALIDGIWQQTFAPTPGSANVSQPYVPCQAGYERNEDTGRCNKLVGASIPAPCDIDEYRSPETGRCRKVAGAASASSLTPCKEGQYRSPETHRCRSAEAVSTEHKPCASGQERNPATNRCRKATQGDGAAGFSVVETPSSSDKLLSWVAIGGMGVASLGYALWEWRRELVSGLGKLVGILPFVK